MMANKMFEFGKDIEDNGVGYGRSFRLRCPDCDDLFLVDVGVRAILKAHRDKVVDCEDVIDRDEGDNYEVVFRDRLVFDDKDRDMDKCLTKDSTVDKRNPYRYRGALKKGKRVEDMDTVDVVRSIRGVSEHSKKDLQKIYTFVRDMKRVRDRVEARVKEDSRITSVTYYCCEDADYWLGVAEGWDDEIQRSCSAMEERWEGNVIEECDDFPFSTLLNSCFNDVNYYYQSVNLARETVNSLYGILCGAIGDDY